MTDPAQVANDMAAQARFWWGRDGEISSTCGDAGRMIMAFLSDEAVDGRSFAGLIRRLRKIETSPAWTNFFITRNVGRARETLEHLKQNRKGKRG